MKTLGIVGGLSPESTAAFYTRLAELSRAGTAYPHVVIDSVPLDFSTEAAIIERGQNRDALLPYLVAAVRRLQHADIIAIPCNTAHLFVDQLRMHSPVPILSMPEAVIAHIRSGGYRRVGLLATTATVQAGVYQHADIEFIAPGRSDQKTLSAIIFAIVRNRVTEEHMAELERIARDLEHRCDAVLLACTDLHLQGPYPDSLSILAEAAYTAIGGEDYE